MGHAVTRVQDDAGGAARGVEAEDGLDGEVAGGDVVGLKEELRRLVLVPLGIQGRLCQQDRVLT